MARKREITTIELPAPTVWPLVLGLGITLIFAGIVTHWLVTVTGAVLALRGIAGWWADVLPVQRVERIEVAVGPPAKPGKAPPLTPGADLHRARLPVAIHPYRAGVVGGLAGAVSMAVVACGYGLIAQGSPWYPINLLAAIAMPGMTDAGLGTLRAFHGGALLVATIVHLVASALVGLLYAVILPMLPNRPLLLGGVITPVLWTALLYATMRIMNPALDQQVSWPWFLVSQVAFGVTAGLVVRRSGLIETAQLLTFAERLRLEKGGRR